MKKNKIISLVVIGVFAAVLAALSQIAIPMPSGVPITLQTYAVAFCGYVLGAKRGTVATLVYVALGAVGIPVFAGFVGGFGALIGMTGGFIWGFIPMTALCGVGTKSSNRIFAVLLGVAGLLVCHLFGVVQFMLVSNTDFIKSVLLVSVPYLIKDVLSVAAAYAVSVMVMFGLKKSGLSLES